MKYKSTQILEKVHDENLSASPEMTPSHGFYGTKKVHKDVKERTEQKVEKEKREKEYVTFYLYIGNFDEKKHLHRTVKEA